ncbi:MAG: ABC transporter ATP-binding protein [Defluviitaleaceae bacterium]|nr:ABC transporter ATP-binding protein [Defluviitaleaceae bacterium]
MSDWIIRTENLEKTYGTKVKTHALKDVSLKIPRGSFSCIIGPSGHGKSTLLQLIGGLDKPTSGRVFIDNIDISSLNDNKLSEIRCEKIGFVFQSFNLLENLTASENIQTAMMFAGTSQKSANSRALELLDMVDLSDKSNSKPSELLGGQLQRVAIARSLANDPDILLMDEPTGNLDSQSEKDALEHIFNIHKTGKTIVVVTHSSDIAKQAELLFEIRDGRLMQPFRATP